MLNKKTLCKQRIKNINNKPKIINNMENIYEKSFLSKYFPYNIIEVRYFFRFVPNTFTYPYLQSPFNTV